MITLGEAARQCGVAKGTISKAIKSGKLSATRNEESSWSIDAAELHRYVEANRHRFRVPQRALMPLGQRRSRRQLTGGLQADPFLCLQDSPAPPLRRPLVGLCRSRMTSSASSGKFSIISRNAFEGERLSRPWCGPPAASAFAAIRRASSRVSKYLCCGAGGNPQI
jgi:excisionase family DNA binding protein